ncbi:MAG: hypothetical protein KYX64_00830 [Sphingopyxis sp.]|nr:hypothetical protein [Sphingopyxis sp.]
MSGEDANTAGGGLLIFDYLYRDASNYKAFGSFGLTGTLSDAERSELAACLDGGEFFVAEQVGVPPLYAVLFEHGGGPSEDDHAWHMFEGFRDEAELPDGLQVWGKASVLLAAFRAAKGNWKPELSPNFDW